MENITNQEYGKVILPKSDTSKEYYVEDLGEIEKKPLYSFIKRLGDIVLSIIAIILCFIPMIIIALCVLLTSEGGIFFKQERLGLNGKPFIIYKFRSMIQDAEKDGAQWSLGDDDPRITKVGRFLRKTRLDELPQFFCILFGTMSFVGPRPERQCFYIEFEKYIHGFNQRLKVKPGLTGLAQVEGGYDYEPERKIQSDVEYIKTRSVLGDISIMFRTVSVIFTGKGAK